MTQDQLALLSCVATILAAVGSLGSAIAAGFAALFARKAAATSASQVELSRLESERSYRPMVIITRVYIPGPPSQHVEVSCINNGKIGLSSGELVVSIREGGQEVKDRIVIERRAQLALDVFIPGQVAKTHLMLMAQAGVVKMMPSYEITVRCEYSGLLGTRYVTETWFEGGTDEVPHLVKRARLD